MAGCTGPGFAYERIARGQWLARCIQHLEGPSGRGIQGMSPGLVIYDEIADF